MIFVDSNVPMYLIGAAHPNKDRTVAVLTRLAQAGEALVTDIEVYQEILHRYAAIDRLDAIEPAFASLDALVDDVLAFGVAEVRAARALLGSISSLSARDALHAAVMASAGVTRIFSFDRGFDAVEELERLS
ncbi:MAG: type II toxin-antitoxin system VapC family toxin [Acidimicrobiales bacterium]|nr:type II toxin-antitoxin system VapC family toxin [Acidimicrobiales bacterium]MYA25919.1 type II toxin-antitoxin system VapC family toxin [Acidimicrobiales bacterium]MYB80780.1 type II toxin-antitoxin system VapC family toxin [Acidimicrobiales bacterium]MYD82200.1 type II toxin-antitoxin system VapC family toxin [Acidimicrobiales bacterium]MYI12382.1 type II toxin-antitoxin system VapC family toxin [Acidimicrobiales bacterium]